MSKTFLTLPFTCLSVWSGNPRKSYDPDTMAAMKKSLLSEGQIQNLVVAEDPENSGHYLVVAGGSRLSSIIGMVEDGTIEDTHILAQSIDCTLMPFNEAAMMSAALAENITRQDMTPLEEADAFMALARDHKLSNDHIAATVGYTPKLVERRLLLCRLTDTARSYLENRSRDLAWAMEVARADHGTQDRIVDQISANPGDLRSADEVRNMIETTSYKTDVALFDHGDYDGLIISDMFDGDFYADNEKFWELQNQKINEMRAALMKEGYRDVLITRKPFDAERYNTVTGNNAQTSCVIEVSPTGQVSVYRDLLEPATVEITTGTDASIPMEETNQGSIPHTSRMMGYVSSHRSAMLQNEVAQSARIAMEIAVLGMLGHGEANIKGTRYNFSTPPEGRHSTAFEDNRAMRQTLDNVCATLNLTGRQVDGGKLIKAVRNLSRDALSSLFAHLVALTVGQTNKAGFDVNPNSLTNIYGALLIGDAEQVRENWTPDRKFLELMSDKQLRHFAAGILPSTGNLNIDQTPRDYLMDVLEALFEKCVNDDTSVPEELYDLIKNYTPGPMEFPAIDDRTYSVVEHLEEAGLLVDETEDEHSPQSNTGVTVTAA